MVGSTDLLADLGFHAGPNPDKNLIEARPARDSRGGPVLFLEKSTTNRIWSQKMIKFNKLDSYASKQKSFLPELRRCT